MSLNFLEPLEIDIAQANYPNILQSKKEKLARGEKLKVAFFAIYDSAFSAKSIVDKMLNDSVFDPYVVIIPDVIRGDSNRIYQLKKTYNTFVEKYGEDRVIMPYDFETNEYQDISDQFDLVWFPIPYDLMTHRFYRVEYLSKKGLLPFYTSYFYMGRTNYDLGVIRSFQFSLFWKIFVETDYVNHLLQKHQRIGGKNAVTTGYGKMDSISEIKEVPRKRKKVIIAPHHTVRKWVGGLNLSNFLFYFDFFVDLPKKYPEIDFVFRPHPLLFTTLSQADLWGEKRVEEYLNKIKDNPNLEYSEGGDYFDLFVNSDALIHDCGSFLAEYFYTEHPQCFLLRNKNEINEEFLPFGKKILQNTYQAYCENEIIEFIDNVVIKGEDTMKASRDLFANHEIKINHPNASEVILNYLKGQVQS